MRRQAALRSALVLPVLLVALPSSSASARPTGEPQECGNCHYEANGPMIDLAFGNDSPAPGETIMLTISLEAVNEEALRTGVFLSTPGSGAFGLVEPDSTRYAMEGVVTAVVHSQPRDLDDQGRAQFQFEWTAPNEVGVTDFTVWSITGNTNGDSSDDHHATVRVGIAHGCEGVYYHPDADGDGFGDAAAAQLSCEPIAGMVEQGGDCDDADAEVRPGAVERCNTRDDDCDGELDDGLEPGLYYRDGDGDGYAGDLETPEFTCNDAEGYTLDRGDCDPEDPDVHPGAAELDNGRDDDCDGEVDEIDEVDDEGSGSSSGGWDGQPDALPGATNDTSDGGGCRVAAGGAGSTGAAWGLALLVAAARRRRRRVERGAASPG